MQFITGSIHRFFLMPSLSLPIDLEDFRISLCSRAPSSQCARIPLYPINVQSTLRTASCGSLSMESPEALTLPARQSPERNHPWQHLLADGPTAAVHHLPSSIRRLPDTGRLPASCRSGAFCDHRITNLAIKTVCSGRICATLYAHGPQSDNIPCLLLRRHLYPCSSGSTVDPWSSDLQRPTPCSKRSPLPNRFYFTHNGSKLSHLQGSAGPGLSFTPF